MILLTYFNCRRKGLILSATFLLGLLTAVSSCTKEEDDFGADIQPSGDLLNYELIDTLSLKTFSVEDDSLRTDETTLSLLGSYVDPVFGKMTCGFVSQIRLESDQPNFGTNPVVDSIVLSLRYAGAYGNLDPQNFHVYRVSEDIDTDEEYNRTSTISFDNNDLALSGSNFITPDIEADVIVGSDTVNPQLRIPLNPSFGQEIIDASGTGNLDDNEAFTTWLKGLFVTVDNPSQSSGEGAVLYFDLLDAASKVTLYFNDGGDERAFSFNINNNCARINQIDTDYSGTQVEDVLQDKSAGQEEFYYQGGAIRSAIEFPHLMNIKDSFPNVIVNKAELVLPIQFTTNDLFLPPVEMTVAAYDKNTDSQSLIFDNFNPNHLDGTYDDNTKEYRFVITRYIQNIFKGVIPNDGIRLLSLEHFSSVSRIIFNGPDTDNKIKPRLELTLTTY